MMADTDPPEWRARTHPALCPTCRHWRWGCEHPSKFERRAGGEPGDEASVWSWLSLADILDRQGLAPGRVKTPDKCPGHTKK